jgi:hypothetical protein
MRLLFYRGKFGMKPFVDFKFNTSRRGLYFSVNVVKSTKTDPICLQLFAEGIFSVTKPFSLIVCSEYRGRFFKLTEHDNWMHLNS